MSTGSEESANYSDAHSGYDLSGDGSPILSSSSGTDASEPRPKQFYASRASISVFRRSESLFLVLLFALVAVLLPTFFFYASNPSTEKKPDDSAEQARKSSLTSLLAYIPAISTLFRFSFSASYTLLRPFIAPFSLILALFAPIFIAVNILFKVLVVLPSRLVIGLVQFFYPVYLFCGTACILGGVVGLGGKLLIEGSRLMFARAEDELSLSVHEGKRRHR